MPDHIHIFIGYKLTQIIPDLVQEIKTSNNAWIKQRGPVMIFRCAAPEEIYERLG